MVLEANVKEIQEAELKEVLEAKLKEVLEPKEGNIEGKSWGPS